MKSDIFALLAILLWATLATIANLLVKIPPFLLTGIGLIIGSLLSFPISGFKFSHWRVPIKTLLVGVYGLFGYHLMLFLALRFAPAVEANLVNYLWPLLIVVLSPVFTKHLELTWKHAVAVILGFGGAALAILGGSGGTVGGFQIGYLFALLAAIIWATYSLWTTKLPSFPTATIGVFGFCSGLLAIAMHFLLEEQVAISPSAWVLLLLLGLGPLGGSFYFWDKALKLGDPRRIGILAFATPLLSTLLLTLSLGESLTWQIGLATVLIVAGAFLARNNPTKP